MIKSMTGFGRISCQYETRSFDVEIKSVNHRYLDINIRMPKSLFPLEENIRKIINQKIKRGKVDIFITQTVYDGDNLETIFNKPLADSYVKCLNNIKNLYKVKDDISVSLIAKLNDVITIQYKEEDKEKLWEQLSNPLCEAVDLLVQMRKKEGQKLSNDLLQKCENIKSVLTNLEEKSALLPNIYKDKLNKRITELLGDIPVDKERIALEVALYADKCCINEEIVRLKSHLNQFTETLNIEEPIGRKLDFIVQEMNREINTIGSKANDLDISKYVLYIKSEIEKIREQIQNIE